MLLLAVLATSAGHKQEVNVPGSFPVQYTHVFPEGAVVFFTVDLNQVQGPTEQHKMEGTSANVFILRRFISQCCAIEKCSATLRCTYHTTQHMCVCACAQAQLCK